jgi:hypothetical protein
MQNEWKEARLKGTVWNSSRSCLMLEKNKDSVMDFWFLFRLILFDSYRDKALTLAFVPPRGREIACRLRM